MDMKDLGIESYGIKCKLTAEDGLIKKILEDDFFYHYIPNSKIVKDSNYFLEIIENPELKNAKAIIDYPKASFASGLEHRGIIGMIDYLFERGRQEKHGIYCLNSATASLDNDSVIFWGGATNLGKTSSMLELVKNEGFNFYADERTLLSLTNSSVVGGSRKIATRKDILKEKTGEKKEFLDYPRAEGEKKIKLMIYPHLDHGLKEPICYRFPNSDFNWLLLREFGTNIRGAIKYVDNYSYPLPSIDTIELAEKRTNEAREFTSNVPCYYFQGSLEQISAFVKGIFKNDKK